MKRSRWSVSRSAAEITVQLEGLARVRLGERLRFGIEEQEIFVFDATTGATLSWPASASDVSG